MSRDDDLQKLMRVPDKVLIRSVDFWRSEITVSAKLGDDIGQSTAVVFAWFIIQKDFKKVTVENLNGTDVIMVRRE